MARLAVRMNTDALGQLLVKSQRDTIALLLRKNLIDLKALAQSLHETLGVICSAGGPALWLIPNSFARVAC